VRGVICSSSRSNAGLLAIELNLKGNANPKRKRTQCKNKLRPETPKTPYPLSYCYQSDAPIKFATVGWPPRIGSDFT
jgi:hypothetical protein